MHIEFCGILSHVQADVVHPPRQDTGSVMTRACLWDTSVPMTAPSFPCFPDVGNMLARLLVCAVPAGGPQGFQHSRQMLHHWAVLSVLSLPVFISINSGISEISWDCSHGTCKPCCRPLAIQQSWHLPQQGQGGFHCYIVAHYAHTPQFTQHPPSEGHLFTGVELEPKLQQTLGCRLSCEPDFWSPE